jgi:hypothetical protein
MAAMRATGVYTQAPGSNPLAARWCGLASASVVDPARPASGEVAFYLVTGMIGSVEGDLGWDSRMEPRPNDNPCP